jgi:hypothetical protein
MVSPVDKDMLLVWNQVLSCAYVGSYPSFLHG